MKGLNVENDMEAENIRLSGKNFDFECNGYKYENTEKERLEFVV